MPTVQFVKAPNKSFIPDTCCEYAIGAIEYSSDHSQSFANRVLKSTNFHAIVFNVLPETKSPLSYVYYISSIQYIVISLSFGNHQNNTF